MLSVGSGGGDRAAFAPFLHPFVLLTANKNRRSFADMIHISNKLQQERIKNYESIKMVRRLPQCTNMA
jgi:hypothetical protein